MSENKKNSESPELTFAKDLAKSFAISTAITAGTLVGFIGVGAGLNKIKEMKENRLKKEQEEFDKKFEDIINHNKK